MTVRFQTGCSQAQEKPNVFVLHCGLDVRRVERSCEKLDLAVNIVPFRREEVFAYYIRLARPSPDMVVIRSHFRSLISSINLQKNIPTLVVSTHLKPSDCQYAYIQAAEGYAGPDASKLYEQLTMAMHQELCSGSESEGRS